MNLSDRLLAEADKEYQTKSKPALQPASQPEPEAQPKPAEPEQASQQVAAADTPPVPAKETPPSPAEKTPSTPEEAASVEVNTKEPAPIAPPVTPPTEQPETRKKGIPQMVTVVLRSLGDKERDILRMRRIYGLLISEPGPDRFAFYVIEHNRGYRLEFPSDTTALTKQIERKLEELVGGENVIIEQITIQ